MLTFLKLIVIVAMWLGTEFLAERLGIEPLFAPEMVFFGAISFFLGPSATGSGFFVRHGIFVDSATPAWIWRLLGIILWVAGAATLYGMWRGNP